MILLPVLRGLTLVVRVVLAVVAILLAVRLRRGVPRPVHTAWAVTAGVFAVVAASALFLESGALGTTVGTTTFGWLRDVRLAVDNEAYILAGVAVAVLPALLLALFAQRQPVRWSWVGVAGVMVLAGAFSLARGGASDWGTMLEGTSVLSFLGMGVYLVFCTLLLLGRLPLVDRWLAGVIIAETAVQLLAPVPEVLFRALGRVDAAAIWDIGQLLRLAGVSVQLGLVWVAFNALRRGGPPELLRRAYAPG